MVVDIMHAARDLRSLTAEYAMDRHEIRFLKVQDFKTHAAIVHSFLLQHITNEGETRKITTAEQTPKTKLSKLRFDSMSGTLRWGDITHTFQKGQRGEEVRIKFFRMLWDERRILKKGVVTKEGKPLQQAYCAVQLNLTSDAHTFIHNKTAKDKLAALIKGINRILRSKKFPTSIERKGGVHLVVVEK